MISGKGLLILLRLPFQLLAVVFQYYVLGQVKQYRKYRHNLPAAMKLVAARAIMDWNILEGALFNKSSVGAVLQETALTHLDTVKHLNNYAKRFLERAYWLVEQENRQPEDLVLIYCHGGAYFLQLSSGQAEALIATYLLLSRAKREKVSILILDYRLACHEYTFPCQMNDLYLVYYQVRESCSRIGLMGDSAGGNLAVGFTQYLKLRDAPKEHYPLLIALVSPWLLLFPDADTLDTELSYVANACGDLVPFSSFTDAAKRQFILGKENRFSLIWSPAAKVPPSTEDWLSIPTFSDPKRSIFLLAGEDETLLDDSVWLAKYALGVPWDAQNYRRDREEYSYEDLEYITDNVEAYIEPQGCHDAFVVFEKAFAEVEKGKTLEALDDTACFGTKRLAAFLERHI